MGRRSGTASGGGAAPTKENEAELGCGVAVALSFDCERELTTIEPLVNGQQSITLVCDGADGVVNKLKSLGAALASRRARTVLLDGRFALQQACASIAIDPIE